MRTTSMGLARPSNSSLRREVADGDLSAERVLTRLDSLRAVTDVGRQHEADVPWRMRFGLYRGNALGSAARDAYTRELNGVLPGVLSTRFAQQLRANEATPGSRCTST